MVARVDRFFGKARLGLLVLRFKRGAPSALGRGLCVKTLPLAARLVGAALPQLQRFCKAARVRVIDNAIPASRKSGGFVVKVNCPRAKAVGKGAVVAYDYSRSGKIAKSLANHSRGLCVKVVGRLVQQQDGGPFG